MLPYNKSHSHTLIQPLFLQVLSIYNSHTLMNKSGGTWGSASWPRILGHVDWRSQRTDPQTLQLVDDSLSHSHLMFGFMSSLRGGSGLFNCSLTQIATWVYNALVNHYENVMVPGLFLIFNYRCIIVLCTCSIIGRYGLCLSPMTFCLWCTLLVPQSFVIYISSWWFHIWLC